MTINGMDIRSYNVKEVRSRMSVMFQDIAKFPDLSVAENIGIGDISAMSNLEIIAAAAEEYNILDFITLDTIIGDLYQKHKIQTRNGKPTCPVDNGKRLRWRGRL